MASDALTQQEIDKLPSRGRGLAHLTHCIGDIRALIGKFSFDKVRILEIGCGYGQALIELALKFGSRVELHGVNREKRYDLSLALRVAAYRGLTTDKLQISDGQVTIIAADAGKRLPYPDGFFHLIVSQMTVVFVPEKARLIEEVARILDPDGIALLHCEFVRKKLPGEFRSSFDIQQGDKHIAVEDYLGKFPCLSYKITEKGDVLQIKANRHLDLQLNMVSQIDLKNINKNWYGVKSVYKLV